MSNKLTKGSGISIARICLQYSIFYFYFHKALTIKLVRSDVNIEFRTFKINTVDKEIQVKIMIYSFLHIERS